MSELVKVSTYKNVSIFYDENTNRFFADFHKTRIEGRSVWDIKGQINEFNVQDLEGIGFILGFLHKIHKVQLIYKQKGGHIKVKYICDDDDYCYDKHKEEIVEEKIYPNTEHNIKIYEEYKKLEKQIDELEKKIEMLKEQLK